MPQNDAAAPKNQELSDAQLIRDYVDNSSANAFETLVRRHYNVVHKRLLSITRNHADADDLAQKLWLRVLEHLPSYQDKQKFPHFLNTIATNLVKDEWRRVGVRNQSSLDEMMENNADATGNLMLADEADAAKALGDRSEITYLIKVLVPQLKVTLRSVFLLRHESEYWDGKQPFQWQHLAELNNIEVSEAVERFLHSRDTLLTSPETELEDLDRLIFLTWTQAQRFDKSAKQTEVYLAELLGIPVNTFKTRYRSALAELSDGLEQWRKNGQAT